MTLKPGWSLALLLLLSGPALSGQRPATVTAGVHVLQPALPMPGLARERVVRVYLPPGYAGSSKRYPVLYMHDGQNLFDDATSFVGEWGVDESLDQLAKERGIELIVVGIDHGGDTRINELSPWANPKHGAAEGKQYLAFVINTVKPFVDGRYRTLTGPADTGIMGSSLGALISHYAIHAHPAVFGKAGILSPSYWFAHEVYDYTMAHRLPDGARLYLVAGSEEGSDTVRNLLRMDRLLRTSGNRRLSIHTAVRAGGKHNETFWRQEFPRAIVHLYGPRKRSAPADDRR